jgi:gelsolin
MPTLIDIADTNLALFGSDIEKKLKYSTAETEPAWKGAGQKQGIQIWRIEKFQVKAWSEKMYGQFYEGDSYIVLQVSLAFWPRRHR